MYFEKMNKVDLYINNNDPVANNVLTELLKLGLIEQSKITIIINVNEQQEEFLSKTYVQPNTVCVFIKSTINGLPSHKVIIMVNYKGKRNYLRFVNNPNTLKEDLIRTLNSFNETVNSDMEGI